MTTADSWGGPARLSAWEATMWRAEGDPRTRSGGILLETLDREPEWERFYQAHDRAVIAIPRLRERVVEPLLPLTDPVWSPDPAFNLDLHVHRARLPEPGGERELFEFIESQFHRPLDRARPPWEATLVTGLEGGRAAYLFKFHHSLSDGLGLVQLLTLAHSPTSRRSPVRHTVIPAARDEYTPVSLLATRAKEAVVGAPWQGARIARRGLGWAASALTSPVKTVTDPIRYAASARRTLAPDRAPRSPLLDNSLLGARLLRLDVPQDDLRAGGRAAGCSLNDAFVAAMLGGLRRYHEVHGVMVDEIPIGMPISLRREGDPAGGNRFTGALFSAPLAEKDPARRMHAVREQVTTARAEPAIGILGDISPVISKLPPILLSEIAAQATTTSDMQVSNIRGIGHPCYLAGAEVLGMYPLGPRPGVAVMAAMITYNGICCVAMNVNPHVFADIEVLQRCLAEGFDEVIALGRKDDG